MIRILLCVTLFVAINGGEFFFQDDNTVSDEIKQIRANVDSLQKTIGAVARQLMLQQLFVEERIRSEGYSGIKQVRGNHGGSRPYHSFTHVGGSVAAIHDHANNIRTVGMGEYIVVLNGVEFRTRHNDYRLYMPHSKSSDYHAREAIPFPDVPPEVTAKQTVAEQIVEMREWFKAWHKQDYKARDYRKYFKPVLCYLEGAWMNNGKGNIEEPFPSDRHFIDAKSWFDLQEKVRFTSYSGRKSNFENYAFLPTTIMNMSMGVNPVFAQWNYRILCHPLKNDLPTNRFRVVDEFEQRMRGQYTMHRLKWTRRARFQLEARNRPWGPNEFGFKEGLLDKLMNEIPGKDNYQGNLIDDAFDLPAVKMSGGTNEKINAAYYNRVYKVLARDAMGLSTRQRGFSDENLYMAMTTQPKVAGMNLNDCKYVARKRVCKMYNQKWTYAIPLEIIYLTPLAKWNPYNIQFKGYPRSQSARTVTAGGRNGATAQKAYNGTHETTYYMTPAAFYNGNANGKDPADTTRSGVWVLDNTGTPRLMSASGVRIFFPSIPGTGVIRQRYPIMPVHGEGSTIWKETSAILDALMQSTKYLGLYQQSINTNPLPTIPPVQEVRLQVNQATRVNVSSHTHIVNLEPHQVADLSKGLRISVMTDERAGHQHVLFINYHPKFHYYYIAKCDGAWAQGGYGCWDKHPRRFSIIESPQS